MEGHRQDIVNRAYMLGMELQGKGLSDIEFVEKLTLKEVPHDVAIKVMEDITIEEANVESDQNKKLIIYGASIAGFGVAYFMGAALITGGAVIFIPGGCIVSGLLVLIYGLIKFKPKRKF